MNVDRRTFAGMLLALPLAGRAGAAPPRPPERGEAPDDETFGAEDNPTGDPIGGGAGYRDIAAGGDVVAASRDDLLAALEAAQPGQVVFVPDGAEIDLAGLRRVKLPAGVTLAGTRGRDGSPGARLFSSRRETSPLFETAGDEVRLTGLRLEGPFGGTERIAENSTLLYTSHFGTRVDNCEVFQWAISGIAGHLGASRLWVHHNHIHHCQRSGYGYGVVLDQCDALIVANRFDHCRHHIASTGAPGSAYEAAWNVAGECTSHLFDMHGGRDRGDGTDIAGDWVHVHHNTFTDPHGALTIRGVPSQGAWVHHNWFTAPVEKAIRSGGNTATWRNVHGDARTLEA